MILITQAALKRKSARFTEDDLYKVKLGLAQHIHEKQIPKAKRQVLLDFLHYYLPFQSKELNIEFEKSINKLTGRTITMGLREVLLEDARHQGETIGEKRGLQQGIAQEKRLFVQTLIRESEFDDRKIASLTAVEEAFVRKLRANKKASV